MRRCSSFLLPLLALMLAGGCSSGNKSGNSETATTATTAAKPAAQLDTGRVAFQRMYAAARMWAPDAQPAHLESEITKASDGADGKAAVWRATFASVSRRSVKSFVWSGVDEDDAPSAGVTPGSEDTYSPSNASLQAFDVAYIKVDSDKAYSVAKGKLKKGAADKPVKYGLSYDARGRAPVLTWTVSFGEHPDETTIDVDGTTGAYIRTEK